MQSLHWGLGIRALGPITRFPHAHTKERQYSVAAYRTAALRNFGLSHLINYDPVRESQGPLAVHIAREQKSGRWLSKESFQNIEKHFKARNISTFACCDFRRQSVAEILSVLARADFVFGTHGAGLSNAVFARKNMVLLELKTWFRAENDLFRKIAQARWGGYVSVLLEVACWETCVGLLPLLTLLYCAARGCGWCRTQ